MSVSPVQSSRDERHVHFADDQVSGSHRPPEAFRSEVSTCTGSSCGVDANPRIYTIRPSVPFDNWFQAHHLQRGPIVDTELCGSRCSAFVDLGKGLLFTLIEAVKYIAVAIFDKEKADTSRLELSDQWHGVCLSAAAIISPNQAREDFLAYWQNPENRANRLNTYFQTKSLNK